MASIVENLIPDVPVLLAQGAVYLASLVAINALVVQPLIKIQKERIKRTLGKKELSMGLHYKSEQLQEKYDADYKNALILAREKRSIALKQGQDEVQKFVKSAQDSARQKLQKNKQEIDAVFVLERQKLPELAKSTSEILLNKLMKITPVIIFAIGLQLLQAGYAFASAEAETSEININNTGWPIFQFLIFFGLLVFVGKKIFPEMLQSRREKLKIELETAKNQLAEAHSKVQELESKIQKSNQEFIELIAQFQKDGENEKALLIAEGQRMAEQITTDAERVIRVAILQGKENLKKELVEQTIKALEMKLAKDNIEKINENLRQEIVGSINGFSL